LYYEKFFFSFCSEQGNFGIISVRKKLEREKRAQTVFLRKTSSRQIFQYKFPLRLFFFLDAAIIKNKVLVAEFLSSLKYSELAVTQLTIIHFGVVFIINQAKVRFLRMRKLIFIKRKSSF